MGKITERHNEYEFNLRKIIDMIDTTQIMLAFALCFSFMSCVNSCTEQPPVTQQQFKEMELTLRMCLNGGRTGDL